jgi:dTMP kinase
VGRLVVIEGIDGAGKRTVVRALTEALDRRGAKVGQLAFPRYGENVHADLVQDALHGKLGDLSDSVHGMAVLFALDRRDARDQLLRDLADHDVVFVDRYIASNAAYQAARLHQDATGDVVAWIKQLEVDRFQLPVPDVQLLLSVPVEVAAARAAHREGTDGRTRDAFETDGALQARCAEVYRDLAAREWLSPWRVVPGAAEVDVDSLVAVALGDGLRFPTRNGNSR